jgi:cell division septation protein DedD
MRTVPSIVVESACALVLAMLLGAGCTAVQKAPPATKKPAEPYRVEKEGTIPPLARSDVRKEVDREEKYEDLPVAEEEVPVEDITPEIIEPVAPPVTQAPAGSTVTAQKTMQGFRVQVFASGSEAAARGVREAAEIRIGAPAYVELEGGVYKVRVGDCPSRPEAEALLQRCRDAGYTDAWIAAGTILMRRAKTSP